MSDDYQLENVPIFRNVPSGQLEPLREAAVRQVYSKGAAIFRQGDIPGAHGTPVKALRAAGKKGSRKLSVTSSSRSRGRVNSRPIGEEP